MLYRIFLFIFFLISYSQANAEADINAQLIQFDDEWIGSLYASTEVYERTTASIDIDSTGYLNVGLSYGDMIGSYYMEGFTNYGRADNVDINDVGIFAAKSYFHQSLTVYFSTLHEWRNTKGFPVLDLDIFDQREWRSTLGTTYQMFDWMQLGYSFNHDRLLSGNRGITDVENKNIHHHDVTLTFTYKKFEPYIRYYRGQYRVRPGEPITSEDTLEIGIGFNF
ncbi:MAG: hypothetical protein HRU20_31590 [Pseudomonadales bacterium]|nr:hypothetical protein [Pseudomonadales bacterium]